MRNYIIILLVLTGISCQSKITTVHGEIFTGAEAEERFGPAVISIALSSEELEQLITKSKEVLMCKISGGNLFILDNDRDLLFKTGGNIAEDEKLSVFSISLIRELLDKGNEDSVFFELRKDVISVSSGNFTLENSSSCPPFC